ncbi:MAG: hypothetical protein JWQ02_3210 [Capsulimonas sp.]|nr:hypothetical protein [Capsulimonas sp.]
MHVALDPSEEIPHVEWLHATPGAYEWWYFDAVSDSREYALTVIWFLGNPFSPYHRAAALGRPADPFDHNGLFFALYRHGRLHAYHFSRFPIPLVNAAPTPPLCLQFGPSSLTQEASEYRLRLTDVNANRRSLRASLDFTAPIATCTHGEAPEAAPRHLWHPAAPSCRVAGRIALGSAMNHETEEIAFTGDGYHDHNRGVLPFAADIREWYWARAALPNGGTLVIYHTRLTTGGWNTDLMLFEHGVLKRHVIDVRCRLGHWRMNAFGLAYASSLIVEGEGIRANVRFRERLDSAPFYLRMLCDVEGELKGAALAGHGIGEYLKPRGMDWALTASAMKARIVEQ